MDVSLNPDMDLFVSEKVGAGQYESASEMVNCALQLLKEREALAPEHENWVRTEVLRGIEQANRGEFSEFDAETIIKEERAQLTAKKRTG